MKTKYNLKDPKDREELTKYALKFEEDALLELHDEMFKKGYRGRVTDLEKKMWYWLGEETFYKFVESNFEYDLLEAKFLGVDYRSPHFQTLCECNRDRVFDSAIEFLPELSMGHKIAEIHTMTESEMRASIRAKWSKPENIEKRKQLEALVQKERFLRGVNG